MSTELTMTEPVRDAGGLLHDLVLLDLDGTISDPIVGIGRSINYALAHFGHPERELEELSACIGPPLDHSFRELTGIEADAQIEALVMKYRERYGDVGYAENVIYPGIVEVLGALSEAGVPLALCTSKRADFAEQILNLFGIRRHFRFVSGGEIGLPKWKQMEWLVSRGLVTPATVMVGDRSFDLIAAHRNGMQAAGVLWGHGAREELEGERPRYLFSSPAELICFTEPSSAINRAG